MALLDFNEKTIQLPPKKSYLCQPKVRFYFFCQMKNTTVRLVVILGIFAITGIVVVQTYWMLRAWDLKEKQLDQSIQIALQNTAQKLAARKKVTLPDNTVKQVSSDYYFVNINDEIDANWLEYYLRTEFMQLQIGLDFEYAIYDCNTDKMMYGNYIKDRKSVV